MEMTIVTGRAGSGKSRRLYREIGDIARRGGAALLLVPEQYTLAAENGLLEAAGLPGFVDVRVMSPSRLMEDVFSRLGGGGVALDGRGKAMALRRVAGELAGELTVFGAMVRRPGFAGQMADLIADLKRFDVAPEDLLSAAADDSLLARKLRDIARLYRAMDAFLAARSTLDEEDRIAAFVTALPRADFLKGVPVFVDEFDYLPPRMVRMLEALLGVSGRLTVALTADDSPREGGLFEAGRRCEQALADSAARLGCPVRRERMAHERAGQAPALAHLERELFASPARRFSGPSQGLHLWAAPAAEEEVEAAAGCIRALVRDGGLRWRDVAVVCGDLPAYLPRVERVFQRHGIPVFLDNRRPVLQHPVVGFLLYALRVVDGGWRKQDVLALLKTGYAGVPPEGVEKLERYVASGWYRSHGAWARPFERPSPAGDDVAELNAWREAFMAPLEALREPGRRAPAARWARALYTLMERAGVEARMEEQAAALSALGVDTAEHGQMWNAVMNLLDQAAGLLGDSPMTAAEVADLLESGFAAAEMGVLPPRGDAVQVGDVGRTKTGPVRHLFVLGTLEGCLPVRYPEGGLLHDRDMERLSALGVEAGRGAALRASQSRQGVYAAFAKPSDGLWVCWPVQNEDNRPPSPLVGRIRRIFAMEAEAAPPPGVTTPAAALTVVADAARELARGLEPGGPWPALAATLARDPALRTRVAALAGGGEETRLRHPALLAGRGAASSSQLERYARCPFAWFVQYALAPVLWPPCGLNPLDAGTLAHRAVERLGRALTREDSSVVSEEQAEAMMGAIYADLCEQEGPRWAEEGRSRWMAAHYGQACAAAARGLLRQLQRGEFEPLLQEAAFGPGCAFAPIAVGGGALLHGRVDRVDVLRRPEGDYLRVIDYKTGQTRLQLAGALQGWQMQLWLYLAALCRAWPGTLGRPARPAGAWYFPVRDDYVDGADGEKERRQAGWLQGLGVDEPALRRAMDTTVGPGDPSLVFNNSTRSSALRPAAQVNGLLSGVMDTARRLTGAIAAGDVEPRPLAQGRVDPCARCEFRGVCHGGVHGPLKVRRPAGAAAVERWIAEHGKEDGYDAVD